MLLRLTDAELTYAMVGETKPWDAHEHSFPGYVVDHNRIKLGEGPECFARAKLAIRQWQMFNLGWVEVVDSACPIEIGNMAVVLAKAFGFWSMNVCRIVYTLDESTEDIDRFGFGYGTLDAHLESGEERFQVEFNCRTQEVVYDLLAFSRPNKLIAKIGYPVVRHFQSKFGRDSKQAMQKFCKSLAQ